MPATPEAKAGAAPPGGAISLGEILPVLIRHKWRILACALAGFGAAAALYKFHSPAYESEAKLFVRYVIMEGSDTGPPGDASRAMSPDLRGETIMQSEVQILTSLDLAKQVAQEVGPENILAGTRGGDRTNVLKAAAVVESGLTVIVPPMTSVIQISFRNHNPAIVQPVLAAVIRTYLKMHVQIHEAVGIVGDFLSTETEQLHAQLDETESELRAAKAQAGVVSVADAEKMYLDEVAQIRQKILVAQADLAEQQAILQRMAPLQRIPTARPAPGAAEARPPPEPTDAQIEEYQGVCERIDGLRKYEESLLTQFTPEYEPVRQARAQLAQLTARKQALESAAPGLVYHAPAGVPLAAPAASGTAGPGTFDYTAAAAQIAAIQSEIKELNTQLDQATAAATRVDQAESGILDLQRRMDLLESNYRYYASSLEQARINEALGNGRVSNISTIQSPSPPWQDRGKLLKAVGGVAVAGIGAGVAWAFLIEMVLDTSLRRPDEIQSKLKIPLFISIPRLNGRRLGASGNGTSLALPHQSEALRPFHDTLRDRIIGFFESKGLTHKPKLVAVTGVGRGAGITSTAAGLARSLSETGDGNVLLVDMTQSQGSAQQFSKGREVCGLDELLETRDTRDHAQVHENLYVVGTEPKSDKLSRALPRRFHHIVPRLKSSDFDYIIFDMPAVNQISITPRLAGFMDLVLLVVEAMRSDREIAKQAAQLLTESRTNVGAVLNKARSHTYPRSHEEFLGYS